MVDLIPVGPSLARGLIDFYPMEAEQSISGSWQWIGIG